MARAATVPETVTYRIDTRGDATYNALAFRALWRLRVAYAVTVRQTESD